MKADINGERAQKLLSAEEQTLKMIARGAALNDVLNNLCDMIDAQAPDTISTVVAHGSGWQTASACGRTSRTRG
jgi:hypothetical protein